MKPVAVTIGIGKHLDYAKKSSEYVRNYLGLETRIITDEHMGHCIQSLSLPKKAHSIKFSIFEIFPDIERVMYHDCDWRPVRQFDIMPYIPDPKGLYFCVDRIETDCVKGVEREYGLKPNSYCNSGWFVADKEQKQMFRYCKDHYFDYREEWGDQCILNQVNKDKITFADRRLNVMDIHKLYHESEVLGFHTSGNYCTYQGSADIDWNTTVSDHINLWDDSDIWSTARQHFVEIYETAKQYRGGNALEVGTFTGMGAMSIRLAGMNVKTLDITAKFLDKCKYLWSSWNINFQKMSGKEELALPEKYDLIFHDSEHGSHVIPEMASFFHTKLNASGKLIVHDIDLLDLTLLLSALGHPKHTITTDYRGRQLGTFCKA
jgi:2-polyprenyl-3-methyl-5-hydroxy-6-metoxy-1,4-benzoquinol methylase